MKHNLFWMAALAVLLALGPRPALAQDASGPEMKLMDGQISDVDWVGSTMVVRWLNANDDEYRETTFSINSEVKIFCGAKPMDFSDINRGDQVTIAYYTDPSTGEMKPVRVTVLVTGTLPPNS
ncbi:MAG: hypothetical protein WCG06_01125 [Candidatus Omnitrophota bacterium]